MQTVCISKISGVTENAHNLVYLLLDEKITLNFTELKGKKKYGIFQITPHSLYYWSKYDCIRAVEFKFVARWYLSFLQPHNTEVHFIVEHGKSSEQVRWPCARYKRKKTIGECVEARKCLRTRVERTSADYIRNTLNLRSENKTNSSIAETFISLQGYAATKNHVLTVIRSKFISVSYSPRVKVGDWDLALTNALKRM